MDATEYTIPPPPEAEFPSEAAAEAAVHDWTRRHGFNVSKSHIGYNEDKQTICRMFACHRSGVPKNTRKLTQETRQRKPRRSLRMGCKMRIKIVAANEYEATGPWQIVWTRDGSHTHNHPPLEEAEKLRKKRRVEQETRARIEQEIRVEEEKLAQRRACIEQEERALAERRRCVEQEEKNLAERRAGVEQEVRARLSTSTYKDRNTKRSIECERARN